MSGEPAGGLGWSDIVALIGAAAWLPQLWRYFQKPRVTPIAGGQIEIGFSELGPIFNPKIAFRVERRDALVTGVHFVIKHERGQITTFDGTQLVETGAQSESTSGEKAFHRRTQDVVALVLTPTAIAERKVLTRERELLKLYENLQEGFGAALSRFKGNSADWVDRVFQSSEYQALETALTKDFVWQPGKYTAVCHVTIAGQKTATQIEFGFMLTENSVSRLRGNIEKLKQWNRDTLEGKFDDGTKKAPILDWVYPLVTNPQAPKH